MAIGIAAKRHAQAVFQIALEENQLEGWRSDLREIASTLSDPNLRGLLENPKVPFSEKAELVKRCLSGIRGLALNLVYLLIVKRRLRMLEAIVSEYERLVDAHRGLEHAEVITAVELDEVTRKHIEERLAQLTGRKVVLFTKVDPKIIGGMVARVGDWLIDGSLKAKLTGLRERLVEAG